jgi:PAS domain S-box-containing protein
MTYHDSATYGAQYAPSPTGIERYLDENDLIVSETDLKGIITQANDVFQKIAAYRLDELIGRPHNLVRHPDMPRCVFKLLWDTIESGREIWAYVVNLAADGAHYWVLAHVTPLRDPNGTITGYRSVRRAPRRNVVDTVADLYRTLLRTEQEAGGGRAGMEASTNQLLALLHDRGQSYEQFVASLT